jgi:hypothetical protein
LQVLPGGCDGRNGKNARLRHVDDPIRPVETVKARDHAPPGQADQRECDARTVVVTFGARVHRGGRQIEMGDALEGIVDEPALPKQLVVVGDVLQSAPSAFTI